jgi:UDPglucose--hexose-1-phosphate uridylyltransferase
MDKLRRVHARDWSHANQKLVSGEECPFCVGHEGKTPPEVKAIRPANTKPDQPGWIVRAVPNLGPAVDATFPGILLEERAVGQYMVSDGFGFHYVIVNTTDHKAHMADVSRENMHDVVQMWRDMTHFVGADRSVKYVSIFENFGPLAGMSIPHPHSQIVGTGFIPPRILRELRGTSRFYEENRECFYCREIEDEIKIGKRIIAKTDHFVAWSQFASKSPYQTVISPIGHQSYFANISTNPSANHLAEFADLLQDIQRRIMVTLNDPDYNLYIHTAPANQPEMPHYHWHCHVEPVTNAILAGFEKGFQVFLNPRSPESSAEDLRNAIAA